MTPYRPEDQSEQAVGYNRRDTDFVIKPGHDQPQRFARDAREIRRFGYNIVLTDKLNIGPFAAGEFEPHHKVGNRQRVLNEFGARPFVAFRPVGAFGESVALLAQRLSVERLPSDLRSTDHNLQPVQSLEPKRPVAEAVCCPRGDMCSTCRGRPSTPAT
jgi:hypothetical protein